MSRRRMPLRAGPWYLEISQSPKSRRIAAVIGSLLQGLTWRRTANVMLNSLLSLCIMPAGRRSPRGENHQIASGAAAPGGNAAASGRFR